MAESIKLTPRVYTEAKMQIDSAANSAISSLFGRQPMYSPYVQTNAAQTVMDDLRKKKEYELYGKLSAYGNGNTSWAIECLAKKQSIYGNEPILADISQEERERITEAYKNASRNAENAAKSQQVFISKVNKMSSEAKLDVMAASTIEDIKSIVTKFQKDVNAIK